MTEVTQSRILRLWMPLEAAWLLMALEGPFVAAVLARMPIPDINLAAFGVAFGFAMLFESPIILIMSASSALVENRESYRRLRNFIYTMNGLVTLAYLVFLCPPVFRLIVGTLMGLPESLTRLIHHGCLLLLPWPAAIGYRRFYQGILVRQGLTRRIAYCTTVRLMAMGATAILLATLTRMPGAWVGSCALSMGVVLEALTSRFWARESVARLKATASSPQYLEKPLTYRGILEFYVPLALTSVLTLGVNPLISFFLGRSRMGLESLAVMPVLNGLIFAFNTPGLSFQEVGITLYGQDRGSRKALKRFARNLALVTVALLAMVVFTPIMPLWLDKVAGLVPELVRVARMPSAVLILLPAFTVFACFLRALLVALRVTRPITLATGLEVAGIALVLGLLTRVADWVGVVAAVTAMVSGRMLASLYLWPKASAAVRKAVA